MRYNNRSPNPMNWEPWLFFLVWGILMAIFGPWLLTGRWL